MIKPGNLLPENEILEQRRTPISGSQAPLVCNRSTNIRCHVNVAIFDVVMLDEGARVTTAALLLPRLEPIRKGALTRH